MSGPLLLTVLFWPRQAEPAIVSYMSLGNGFLSGYCDAYYILKNESVVSCICHIQGLFVVANQTGPQQVG